MRIMSKYIYFAILCLTLMMAGCNKNEAKEKVNDPTGKFMKIVDRGLCQADGSEFTIKGVKSEPLAYTGGLLLWVSKYLRIGCG